MYSSVQKDRKEAIYSIIFKHVRDDKLTKLDKLYKELLSEIINTGFDYEQVQASINKKNFSIKEEVNKTSSPKGVSYTIRLLRTWLYDEENILKAFDLDGIVNSLQQNCDEKNFEKLAKNFILENNKQAVIHLLPTTEKENKEKDLISYKSKLSEKEVEEILEETKKLQEWQASTDKKEDLEKIKSVDAREVELKNPFNKTNFETINNIKYSHFNTITNGISYSKLLFDITDFSVKQLQYASLLTYLLFNFNTKEKTEAEVVKEISANLGGLSSHIDVFRKYKSDKCEVKFIVGAKNLVEKAEKLVTIMEETTLNADFDNKEALYSVLLEIKLMLDNKFKNSGHAFVARRISSYNSIHGKLTSYHSEYDFYLFIEGLLDNFEQNITNIQDNLYKVVKLIFNRSRLLVNFVGDNEEYINYKKIILSYINKLPNDINKQDGFNIVLKEDNYSEGFYFDSLVQYVGVGYNVGHYSGTHLVLRHILSLDYLWNNVRVRNGAYGSGAIFSTFGDFTLWSYRDPNLTETLDIYYNIAEYIANFDADNNELNKYIIGALNTLDVLMSPSAQASYSLAQYLTESPYEKYDVIVSEIKNTTVTNLKKLCSEFENRRFSSFKCVLGAKEKVLENKELFTQTIELK